ncbi:hypothetical protein ES703_41246 [subsurface metagenome]
MQKNKIYKTSDLCIAAWLISIQIFNFDYKIIIPLGIPNFILARILSIYTKLVMVA